MSIRINQEKCIKCRRCSNVCPGNVITVGGNGTIEVLDKEVCWGCAACLKECPCEAIIFFLGTDIGGRGGIMKFKRNSEENVWSFSNDKRELELVTVGTESNKY